MTIKEINMVGPCGHALTTDALALDLSMKPQSLRKRFSQTGSYFGLRPMKLPNGRLLWPPNSVEILAKGLAQ